MKFGILHFMAIASLILMLFVDKQKVLIGIIFITLILKVLIKQDPNMFLFIPKRFTFVTGFYSSYSAVDVSQLYLGLLMFV